MEKVPLLLEVGVEEIPAGYIKPAINQFADDLVRCLKENHIEFDAVTQYSTPRRLTLAVTEVQIRQDDRKEWIQGPARQVALDDEGNYTKAAIGFARSQNVDPDSLEVRKNNKGEYIYVEKMISGKDTSKILAESLPDIIAGLKFPKSMRWKPGGIKFARPIRWIVALLGDEIIPAKLDGIEAGRKSKGHMFLSPDELELNAYEDYLAAMDKVFVMADADKRRTKVKEQIEWAASEAGGTLVPDEDLLDTVTNLVEFPTPVVGNIESNFMELPKEVLITSLRYHQNQFSVAGANDELLPNFITVRNGNNEHLDIVRAGNERVLRARLADAEFFYQEDIKTSLHDKVQNLSKVTFIEGTGSLHDKTKRVITLSSWLGRKMHSDEMTIAAVIQAAGLCKADLVTEMVNEFPELQGVMGRVYAARDGSQNDVANGIEDHYKPRFAGDDLPRDSVGAIVAICDKMDTIAACFQSNLIPSGSEDPYALRRSAQGIIKIILKYNITKPGLKEIAKEALSGYKIKGDIEALSEKIVLFFKPRLSTELTERKVRYDIADAILSVDFDNIPACVALAEALTTIQNEPDFTRTAVVSERTKNILKGQNPEEFRKKPVSSELFENGTEKALFDHLMEHAPKIKQALDKHDFEAAIKDYVTFAGPLHQFFADVMVMTEDADKRVNRLHMLDQIYQLFAPYADLARIEVPKDQKMI